MMDIFEHIFSDKVMGKVKTALLVVVMLLVFALVVALPLSVPFKVADAEGEITEIREADIQVVVRNVNFLAEGMVIDNPMNVTAGICFNAFNPYFRCNIGTKVRLTRWVNVWADWWFQEAIISEYTNISAVPTR